MAISIEDNEKKPHIFFYAILLIILIGAAAMLFVISESTSLGSDTDMSPINSAQDATNTLSDMGSGLQDATLTLDEIDRTIE